MLDILVLVSGRQFATRFRWVADSGSGRWATLRTGFRVFRMPGACLRSTGWSRREGPGVLVELGVVEQRYRAVLEVLEW